MNWIKLGTRTINLDLVISYHEEYDEDECLQIEIFCVGDEDSPSYTFTGDEAYAFKNYMDIYGSVKVLLAAPEPPDSEPDDSPPNFPGAFFGLAAPKPPESEPD